MRIELGDGGRRVQLVAPQCFGELSALTGDPVSATVVAHRDVQAWVLSAPVLFEAMAQETAFFRNVATLLGMRLRERTRRAPTSRPRVVLLPIREEVDRRPAGRIGPGPAPLRARLRARRGARATTPQAGPGACAAGARKGTATRCCCSAPASPAARPCSGTSMPTTCCSSPKTTCPACRTRSPSPSSGGAGRSRRRRPCSAGLTRSLGKRSRPGPSGSDWSRERQPALDHLVRRLCGRDVGVAMSVGAAAGLAHLGVLEVLEDDGLPIDFLCGSSMGGAVALAFAHFGSARTAKDEILRLVAEFARRKGLQWLPRASLISASRMTSLTEQLFGDATFAQLRLPIAVVAADLAMGKRAVLDTGPVAPAARATAAIPGVFAPVRVGDALLVDGAVVSRLPVDLLAARGCGFKLAALVRPTYPQEAPGARAAADRLEQRLQRPFGLRAAMGGAYRLQGWWDSASHAGRADLSLTVPIPVGEGFNFAMAEAMVECGRRTARERLPQIRLAMQQVLAPGVP